MQEMVVKRFIYRKEVVDHYLIVVFGRFLSLIAHYTCELVRKFALSYVREGVVDVGSHFAA